MNDFEKPEKGAMANREDRDLGMGRPISRRDVLNGIGALAVGTMIPGRALADKVLALERAGEAAAGYPPALTGLRGSHADRARVTTISFALQSDRQSHCYLSPLPFLRKAQDLLGWLFTTFDLVRETQAVQIRVN